MLAYLASLLPITRHCRAKLERFLVPIAFILFKMSFVAEMKLSETLKPSSFKYSEILINGNRLNGIAPETEQNTKRACK